MPALVRAIRRAPNSWTNPCPFPSIDATCERNDLLDGHRAAPLRPTARRVPGRRPAHPLPHQRRAAMLLLLFAVAFGAAVLLTAATGPAAGAAESSEPA